MVRLTTRNGEEDGEVIVLEGWLQDGDVPLLLQELARLPGGSRQVRLDLAGLRGASALGLVVLRRCHEDGVKLSSSSMFLQALLKSHGVDVVGGS